MRSAITSVLTGMRDRVERALADESARVEDNAGPLSPEDALDTIALQAAGKHGSRPTPRTVRMPKADRARGIAFMVRLFMGYELDDRLTDAKLAEQAMGLSAGRRGPGFYRWLDGSPEDCIAARRHEHDTHLHKSALAAIKARRDDGNDPTHGGAAAQKRAAKTRARIAAERAWEAQHEKPDPAVFQTEILPTIQAIPTSQLERATGLSRRYLAMIRRGEQTPHPRHWPAFRDLGLG